MTGPSLLQAAVDELYAEPLAEFTARRKSLAAAAKKAGDRVGAMAIGALRKPTLSADTVNRLVRHAPREVDELLQLGTDLRTAEMALDAAELRRLGDRRRRLVGDLAQLAFDITGQSSPSGAVREEVTATLNAALADEEVAQRLVSGALVTQARWDGFGSTQLPELASSTPLAPPRPPAPTVSQKSAGEPHAAPSPTQPDRETAVAPDRRGKARTSRAEGGGADEAAGGGAAEAAGTAADEAAGEAAAEAAGTAAERAARSAAERAREDDARRRQKEQDKERRLAEAAAADAAAAAAAATGAAAQAQELVATIDRRISELNLQLAHQRQLLADAQRALRVAESRRRAAQLAATKAGAPSR